MKTIIDNAKNIILVAETSEEQRLIHGIPDVKILFQGDQKNPRTNMTDHLLVLSPAVREPETIVIEKLGDTTTTSNTTANDILEYIKQGYEQLLSTRKDEIQELKKTVDLLNKNLEFQTEMMAVLKDKVNKKKLTE